MEERRVHADQGNRLRPLRAEAAGIERFAKRHVHQYIAFTRGLAYHHAFIDRHAGADKKYSSSLRRN